LNTYKACSPVRIQSVSEKAATAEPTVTVGTGLLAARHTGGTLVKIYKEVVKQSDHNIKQNFKHKDSNYKKLQQ